MRSSNIGSNLRVARTTAATGLPGLRRLDHIGFTVPDLDEAPRFLVDVLGCEYLYSLGPFRDDDGDWMARAPQRATRAR